MSRAQANALLTLIALVWGSTFVFQSRAMAHLGPMAFTGIRFLMGAAVILPLVLWEARAHRRRQRQLSLRALGQIGLLGLLLWAGAVMQQIGLLHTSVTHAGFLTALYVPLVPLLGWLLHRHWPHWSVWPGALACVVGAYLLAGVQSLALNVGDAWVIASALPWALHVLYVGRVAHQLEAPFAVAAGQFIACGLLASVWAWVAEPVPGGLPLAQAVQQAATGLLWAGVMSVGLAFTAQVVAQRRAHAADAAIILSSETVFAAGFGYWLMGDRLTPAGLAGCTLIFLSMLAVQLLPTRAWQRRAAAAATPKELA